MPQSRPGPVLVIILLLSAFVLSFAVENDSLSLRISSLDAKLEQNSNDYEALLERGRAYLEAGRLDEAQQDFNMARGSESSAVIARARMGLGDLYRARPNRNWWAVREYRLAMKADSTFRVDALYAIARTAFDLAMTDGYELACDELTQVIRIDPLYKDALEIWWNNIYIQSDSELRDVCSRLEEVAGQGSGSAEMLMYIARIRKRLNQPDSTVCALERLEAFDPEYRKSERLVMQAEVLLEQGDTLGFEECYDRSLQNAKTEEDYTELFRAAEPIFNPAEAAKWDSLETPEQRAAFFNTFWKRRDPDPTTPHNERLLSHFQRLLKAKKQYWDIAPHSFAKTSHNYYRLTAPRPVYSYDSLYFDSEYDPDIWWDNCRQLALQQKGLFYIRHGEPDMIYSSGLPWETGIRPLYEAWRYGNNFYLFTPESGSYYAQKSYAEQGNITQAMKTESFRDPLPNIPQATYGTDFKGAGGKLEAEFYSSIPVSLDTISVRPNEATVVVYDDQWYEILRRNVTPRKVFTGRDSMWIAVNSVTMEPGPKFYALRMEVPGYRVVSRRMIDPQPYKRDSLDMSGFVLGSPPPPGVKVHRRWGIDLLPRPSLAFRRGEIITVYTEVYGLAPGPDGGRSFDEQVTVTLEGEMADESIIRKIFGSKPPRTSLTLNFERYPNSRRGPFAENFNIDTSELAPGKYSLVVGITDRASGQIAKRACTFRLVE